MCSLPVGVGSPIGGVVSVVSFNIVNTFGTFHGAYLGQPLNIMVCHLTDSQPSEAYLSDRAVKFVDRNE